MKYLKYTEQKLENEENIMNYAEALGESEFIGFSTKPLDNLIQTNEILGDFQIYYLLGKGAYGHVWKIKQLSTGTMMALKVIKKTELVQHKYLNHLHIERKMLDELGSISPFIVKLYHAFHTPERIYFAMEVFISVLFESFVR